MSFDEDYRRVPKWRHELELVEYEQFQELEKRVEKLEIHIEGLIKLLAVEKVDPNSGKGNFLYPFLPSEVPHDSGREVRPLAGGKSTVSSDVEVSQPKRWGRRKKESK